LSTSGKKPVIDPGWIRVAQSGRSENGKPRSSAVTPPAGSVDHEARDAQRAGIQVDGTPAQRGQLTSAGNGHLSPPA
jgi:hypothetical protein